MRITRHRDRRTIDLPDAEARWLIDHGFATKAKPETGKGDSDSPAEAKADEPRSRGRRRATDGAHSA